jgi:hypothetical protein
MNPKITGTAAKTVRRFPNVDTIPSILRLFFPFDIRVSVEIRWNRSNFISAKPLGPRFRFARNIHTGLGPPLRADFSAEILVFFNLKLLVAEGMTSRLLVGSCSSSYAGTFTARDICFLAELVGEPGIGFRVVYRSNI